MNFLYDKITYIFDPLHHLWEHEKMHKKISFALVLFFLISLVGIELNRRNLLPGSLASIVPLNHFFAVQAAFTVVLILEVISLVFTIPCSFSKSSVSRSPPHLFSMSCWVLPRHSLPFCSLSSAAHCF